jgi:hypothetical protein
MRRLHLENSSMRVYNLILGSPNNWVRSINHLEVPIRQFHVMQEEHREAVIELEALWSSTTRV